MAKLSMVEKTSDISTDSDCNAAKMKRRKHARKIFTSEEGSSESDRELTVNKYLSPLPRLPQRKLGKKSAPNIDSSSKTCATQPDINDQENIDVFSNANEQLPLPMPSQVRYGKRFSNIGFSSKPRTTQLDIDAYSDEENVDKYFSANKLSKSDMVIADQHCNLCKVVLSYQKDILKLVVESNLRGKKCETILHNIMEKVTNQNSGMLISDINSDADFYPEYLPAQTLEDFHAAEDKWK